MDTNPEGMSGRPAGTRGSSRLLLRRRIAAIVLVGVVGFAGYSYLDGKPEQVADDYREAATPAARDINRSLNAVYASFDRYLDNTSLPRRQLKGVDDFDEVKRRLMPLYANAKRALKGAKKRIAVARRRIDAGADILGETERPFLVGGAEAIAETEQAAASSKDYLKRAGRFLASFEAFAAYELKALALRRRSVRITARSEIDDVGTPSEFRAVIRDQRGQHNELIRELRRLQPHRDATRLHETTIDLALAYVDFLDDVDDAVAGADLIGLIEAEDQYFRAAVRLGAREQRQLRLFAAESGLQSATRTLTERANALEDGLAELGSGGRKPEGRNRWKRPELPAPPTSRRGQEGEGQIS